MSNSNKPKGDFYQPLSEAIKKRSSADKDVPVDPTTHRFVPGFLKRTVDQQIGTQSLDKIYDDRVRGRAVLLTNPYKEHQQQPTTSTQASTPRNRNKKKPTITAREKRKLGIYKIPEGACKYELFKPLNRLWRSYVGELMFGKNHAARTATGSGKSGVLGSTALAKIMKADLHGASVGVARSRCPNYVGIEGIVVQETKHMFRVVTARDRVVSVPKAHTVFLLEVPGIDMKLTLFGDQLLFRASERAAKKFKPKPTVDL